MGLQAYRSNKEFVPDPIVDLNTPSADVSAALLGLSGDIALLL